MESNPVDCRWYVVLRDHHRFLTITITKLSHDHTLHKNNSFELGYIEQDIPKVFHSINLTELYKTNITIQSPVSMAFFLKSRTPHMTDSLLIQVPNAKDGYFIRSLPVVKVSNSVGFVTSPAFDGVHDSYPTNYDGQFKLDLPAKHSVIVNFHTFNFRTDYTVDGVCNDSVVFNADNVSWEKCALQSMHPEVYRDFISVEFYSRYESEFGGVGFKMIYAIVPRALEPHEVSEGVYNCSVSHFDDFAPALRCNMVLECAGAEDERDCEFPYDSQECGQGYFKAGPKCYRFVKRHPQISWNDAYHTCQQNDEHLVTMATPVDVKMFMRMVVTKKGDAPCWYMGLRQASGIYDSNPPGLVMLYRRVWRWSDGRTVFFMEFMSYYTLLLPVCAIYPLPFYARQGNTERYTVRCRKSKWECNFMCEKDMLKSDLTSGLNVPQTPVAPSKTVWKVNMVDCPSGHVTRDYLSCDPKSQCGVKKNMKSCQAGNTDVKMFVCEISETTVHYTLVCDHVKHCPDNSDEDFCQFDPCPAFRCKNGQCISTGQLCDGKVQCFDYDDEINCDDSGIEVMELMFPIHHKLWPPFEVNMNGLGEYTQKKINVSIGCNSTHFLCPGGVCLPLYLRCNNVDDCPGREDEAGCETYTCPGFYRCWGSQVCLHPDYLCDGVRHCLQQDDEMLCNTDRCPDVCQCQGLAFVCSQSFNSSMYPEIRFLDAKSSGMTPGDLDRNTFLVYADLSHCGIDKLQQLTIPNLKHLDLSWNKLSHINMKHFILLKNLRVLILAGNYVSLITSGSDFSSNKMNLYKLDLSHNTLGVYNGTVFTSCPSLNFLNLSWSHITEIADGGFQNTPLLETLDTRHSHLTFFPTDLLSKLNALKSVYTDIFKLCCRALLPEGFDPRNCYVKDDLLASCEDLLKSNTYRTFLWIFAVLAVVGNFGSFVARICLDSSGLGSFGVFVINLTVADLFMGIYLAVVGTADLVYQGRYLFHDTQWKNSLTCSIAGFLSLLSCEVSAFNICLITLDRFLVLRFPFSQLHFGRCSAVISCIIIWTIGCVLAAIPLLPATSHWQFFSQTGICIPLPFTSSDVFPGHDYSFTVMIMLNLILFMFIACGQAVIYRSVQANLLVTANKESTAQNATIARRLTTVVVSDFLCWFPIGLLGVLATTGTPIQDELNVAMAIFVLPVNSALNPFLYTMNVLMEKQRKAKEAKLLQKLQSLMC